MEIDTLLINVIGNIKWIIFTGKCILIMAFVADFNNNDAVETETSTM